MGNATNVTSRATQRPGAQILDWDSTEIAMFVGSKDTEDSNARKEQGKEEDPISITWKVKGLHRD